MTSIYGDIITGIDVEKAAADTIQLWLPDYLAEVGAKYGFARGTLPVFRSYVPALTIDKFEEDQTPSCVIVAPGTLDVPERRQGAANVRWSLGIGCVVSGKDRDNTRLLAVIYAAAVRTMLLQKSSLGGFAEGVNWISERYDSLPASAEMARTLGAGVLQFGVDVNKVSLTSGGPMAPVDPAVAPSAWPVSETIVLTVTQGS